MTLTYILGTIDSLLIFSLFLMVLSDELKRRKRKIMPTKSMIEDLFDPFGKTVDEIWLHYNEVPDANKCFCNRKGRPITFMGLRTYEDIHPTTKGRTVNRVKIKRFIDDYPTGKPIPNSYYAYHLDSFEDFKNSFYPRMTIYIDTDETELEEQYYDKYWFNVLLKHTEEEAMQRNRKKCTNLADFLFG